MELRSTSMSGGGGGLTEPLMPGGGRGKGEEEGVGGAKGDRCVYANDRLANAAAGFCGNVVITSKYTAVNFVPKFLFEQFSRFANAFFLIVSALQMVPPISITAGVPTTVRCGGA